MKLNKLFCILAASVFSTAFASEFNYHTPAGMSDVTVKLNYATESEDDIAGDTESTNGLDVDMEYEWGWTETYSFFGGIGYTTGSEETEDAAGDTTESDFSGLQDVVLGVKGQRWNGFHYGVFANLSPGNAKLSATGAQENAFTGRHTIAGFIGYDYQLPVGILGGKLTSDIVNTDATAEMEGVDTDIEASGGRALTAAAFYELPKDTWLIGFAVEYSTLSEVEFTGGFEGTDEAKSETRLKTYGTWHAGKGMMLLPQLTYSILGSDDDDFDSGSAVEFTVALRMEI